MPRRYGETGNQQFAGAPAVGTYGATYYDTALKLLFMSDGTKWIEVSSEYVASRGPGLVTNGSALLGTNYNFSTYYNLIKTDHPVGAPGSFEAKTANAHSTTCEEFIPVDPAAYYDMTFAYRQVAGTARTFYSCISPYDADKQNVGPQFYMEQANTRTTLAAQLTAGNTTVTLTSAANWNNAALTYTWLRSLIFWGYTDGQGYTWPAGTYSRYWYSDVYADGGISGNVITLKVPWAGPTFAAGTVVGNGSSGGNYMYGASNVAAPATWTDYRYRYGGVHTNILTSATSSFPMATAYVKLGFLHNYTGNDPTAIARVGNINLVQVSAVARQGLPAGGALNQILSKKSTTDYDTQWVTDPGATGTAGGDLAGTYPNPAIAAGVIVDADVNASANIAQSKIAGLATSLGGKADKTTTVAAGLGLVGGGDLSVNRALDVGEGVGIAVKDDNVGVAVSGVWGDTVLDPVTYGTDTLMGKEIYADDSGHLRAKPDTIPTTNAKNITDAPDVYPTGMSIMTLSQADAIAKGWPATGMVVTFRRYNDNVVAQTFYQNTTGPTPFLQYRSGNGANTPKWGPWVNLGSEVAIDPAQPTVVGGLPELWVDTDEVLTEAGWLTSGTWGVDELATTGSDPLKGREVYLDSNGQLRGKPDEIPGKPVTDLSPAYPIGTSVFYISGAQAPNWPGGTQVVTHKTYNGVIAQWCYYWSAAATKSWYRNGTVTGWSPWVKVADSTADTGWIDMPFETDWLNYSGSFQQGQYRKIGNEVNLRGLVKTNIVRTGTAMVFLLPAGFRPLITEIFACACQTNWTSGAASTGTAHTHTGAMTAARVDISTTGSVTAVVSAVQTYAIGGWVSFSGVSFFID